MPQLSSARKDCMAKPASSFSSGMSSSLAWKTRTSGSSNPRNVSKDPSAREFSSLSGSQYGMKLESESQSYSRSSPSSSGEPSVMRMNTLLSPEWTQELYSASSGSS